MVVTYFGGGSFRLQSGEKSLLVDPANNRLKADVILETTTLVDDESRDVKRISFSGEYEVRGIDVRGIGALGESDAKTVKTMYVVRFDDINFVFLGRISNVPDVKLMEQFNEPDVLFLTVGGGCLMPEAAAKIVKQLEPSLIFPAFADDSAPFLKLLGQKADPQDKFVFKKKDLEETQRVVVLKEN